ncbi:hypothetical protein [Psychroflexus aestuariivivens]|uniref:hypothetical protein n=1 Tax=Psychroflexus aestuariivivens TaxID=1795040 RepID=UPI000FD8D8C8|nr:hypothetical protein [Psychroflexus aestuariivivens]
MKLLLYYFLSGIFLIVLTSCSMIENECTSEALNEKIIMISNHKLNFKIWGNESKNQLYRPSKKISESILIDILDDFSPSEKLDKKHIINLVLFTKANSYENHKLDQEEIFGTLIYYYSQSKLNVCIYEYTNGDFIEIKELRAEPKFINTNDYFLAGELLTNKKVIALSLFNSEEKIPEPHFFGQDFTIKLKNYKLKKIITNT